MICKRFLLLVSCLIMAFVSRAANFQVTNANNAGPGSLRQAILDANAATAGPHTITFTISGIINLASPLPAITKPGITIDGGGTVIISANVNDVVRDIFTLNTGANNTTLKGMTLQNTGSNMITVNGALNGVIIENIIIRNTANDWINNGIYVAAAATNMTIRNVTVTDIQDHFWGIRFVGAVNGLTIDKYKISGGAGGQGRGIQFQGAATNVTVKNSTIDMNDPATTNDGDYGIYFNGNVNGLTVDSTVMHDAEIYGIYVGGVASNVTIKNSTFDNLNGWTGTSMVYFRTNVNNVLVDSSLFNLDLANSANDGDVGIYFFGNMQTVTIRNSTFIEADTNGIFLNYPSAATVFNHDNVLVSKNTFERNGSGTNATGGVQFVGLRNTASDGGKFEISDNTFLNNNGISIYLRPGNGGNYVVPNLNVSRNVITGTKASDTWGAGIRINYIDKLVLSQNSIYSNNGLLPIDLTNGSDANCAYEGASTPQLLSSVETSDGSGVYTVTVKLPALCGTAGAGKCTVELFSNEAGLKGINAQHYVNTYTNLASGNQVLTNVTGVFPEITGSPYGTWTATLRTPTCGTSEVSNKIAIKVNGPGGVDNGVSLWLNPDVTDAGNMAAGIGWEDFSGNNRNFNTVVSDPSRVTGGLNYNHYINFDGDDYLRSTASPFANKFTAGEAIVVAKTPITNAERGNPYDFGGTSRNHHYTWSNAAVYDGFGTTDRLGWNPATKAIIDAKPGIASVSGSPIDVKRWNIYGTHSAAGNWGMEFNGGQQFANTTNNTVGFGLLTGNEHVGATSGWPFIGDIAEEVLYNRALTAVERQRVNTYMALRFGLTLYQDYIASNGSTVWWSLSANNGFNKAIAGIAKDAVGILYQKQSRAVSAADVVTIGVGSVLYSTNEDNPGSIRNDRSALMWGTDSAAVTYGTPFFTAYSDARMTRRWKVQKTGWSDTTIIIRLTGGNANRTLLVSTDPAFLPATTTSYALNDTGVVILNSSLLANGAYFTFSNKLAGPGCITNGIQVWYRADDPNADVNAWSDYSGYDRTAVQAAAANQPIFRTSSINFQPAFNFDGTNDHMNIPSNLTIAGTNPFTVISVSKRESLGTADMILGGASEATNTFSYFYSGANKFALGPINVGNVSSTGTYSTANIPYLNAFTRAGNVFNIYTNGAADGSGTQAYNFLNVNQRIGWRGGSTVDFFDGNISEIVVYNRALNATELQAVNSYLALKYGITLNNGTTDYLASNGTTKMWEAAANAGYNKDIAGLGRDTCDNLHQKQSRSVNASGLVTMALGDAIAADNKSNTFTVINNLSFLTWGDNGGAVTYNVNVNAANATLRMPRIWKVDKTNWADQEVTIKLNGSARNTYLLISTDAAFATIAQELALNNDDSTVTINTSLLADGAFFTFAKELKGPAYVNNGVQMWLRADDGISSVNNWYDFSGNDINATQDTVAKQPVMLTGALNYNPSFKYDGTDDYTKIQQAAIAGKLPIGNAARTIIGVGLPLTANDEVLFTYGSFVANQASGIRKAAQQNAVFEGMGAPAGVVAPANTFPVNKVTLIGGRYTGGATGNGSVYANGLTALASATRNWNTVLSVNGAQVAKYVGESRYWTGHIGELIVYNRNISNSEFQRVSSYLSLKYGITLDQTTPTDYIATDSTTRMWTAADNTGYGFRIAGIGRDDLTSLNQKQSRSAEADALLSIAAGTSVAADNASNTASIDDLSFFTWSDNNGATTFSILVTGLANATSRIARVWKVDKTNWTDQDITIKIDQIGNRYLLVNATDPAFGAGSVEYPVNTTNGTVTLNSADLPDGAYFTIATKIVGPGCVNPGIAMWLRADYGADNASWNDFSGNQVNGAQATAANQPVFAAGALNYNPALSFNGTTQHMVIPNALTLGKFAFGNTARTVVSVGIPTVLAAPGYGMILSYGANTVGGATYIGQAGGGDGLASFGGYNTVAQNVIGTTGSLLQNIPRIIGGRYDGTTAFLDVNGAFNASKATAWNTNNAQPAYIGKGVTGVDHYWNGRTAEVIVYNRTLNAEELLRVNSYLALKYGITLNNGTSDYVASNGATRMWTAADNAGYNFRITGVGRDNCQGLHQKQSRSQETGGIVTIALGSSVAASSAENLDSVITDNSYLVFADNNLDTAYTVPLTVPDLTSTMRMPRIWKVDKTNWTDADITIKYHRNVLRTFMLVSTDPTFATGVQEIAILPEDSLINISSDVLPDGVYFTFAKEVYGPGAVANGITMWLRADDDLAGIDSWNDYSGNDRNAEQFTAANQPVFNDNSVNYNPAFTFNGTATWMETSQLPGASFVSNSYFTVSKTTSVTAIGNLISAATNANSLMEFRYNNGQIAYGEASASSIVFVSSPAGSITANMPSLLAVTQTTGANNTKVYQNGNNSGTGTINMSMPSGPASFELGRRHSVYSAALYFPGDMNEVIAYDRILSDAEQARVNSYLALKYGITLNNGASDYIASDGTTKMWDALTGDNTTYKNNIAGIGRDDNGGLLQKQSRSINTANAGNMLAIGLSSIETTNKDNQATFTDDLNFMVWGDNGVTGLTTTTVSGDGTTTIGDNACLALRRLARVWKVQETGTVANTQLQVDLTNLALAKNAKDLYLAINATDNFTGTVTRLVAATSFVNNIATFDNVDFSNGQYFTVIGEKTTAPAGITSGIQMWLKAEDGVTVNGTAVTQWADQSPAAMNAAQATAANQPVYVTDAMNFNPALKFDGAADFLQIPQASITGKFPAGNAARTIIGVALPQSNATDQTPFTYGTFAANQASGFRRTTTAAAVFEGDGLPSNITGAANTFPLNEITMVSGRYTGGASGTASLFTNGLTAINSGVLNWATTISAQGAQVGKYVGENRYWNGSIGELLVYDRNLTDDEFQRISSYLALKYGLTLNQTTPTDYLASDGTTKMWTAANNSGYNFHITGIGRDDCSALNQKQSGNRDTVTAGYVTLALGALAASNAENTTDFDADKAFLTLGDDNGATTFSTAITGQSGVNYRLERIWKAQETGSVGTVQVLIPDNGMEVYMIVSSDATFDNTDAYYPMTAVTVNGVNYLAADVDLANAQYFTFGANIKAPGGIVGVNIWLRADKGAATADNTPVATWNDYSHNGNTVSQAAPASQPLYLNNATGNINFNPVVRFDGANSGMVGPSLLKTATINGAAAFLLSNQTSASASVIFTEPSLTGGSANYFTLHATWDDNVVYWDAPFTGNRISYNTGGVNNQTVLWTTTSDLALATGKQAIYKNGLSVATGNNTAIFTGNNSPFQLGRNANSYNGRIGELIIYVHPLTAAQQQQINSYLAVKYGVTLNNGASDYIATDGSTKVWDATANSAYKTNIAGIGRDDTEDLYQKQSRSINTGSILTVGLDSIAATNADNTNTFAQDRSYFMWSSNSAVLTTTTTDLPASSCMEQRLTQEWKTQLSNFDIAAHPLRLQFDLTGLTVTGTALSDFILLIDQDGDGNFATGTVTRIPATDFSSGIVGFDNITTLSNGVVFTLVTSNPAATRTAALVADNTVKSVTTECVDNDWLYFIDPADATKYIAAIQLNGNTMDVAQLSAVIDVNRDMNAALGKNSGTDYGTQLMRRLVQITYSGADLTVNGGVKLRLFWDPAEKTNAENFLSGTRGVATTQKWTWFKHTGDIAATLADLAPAGLANITVLTPSGTGTQDGVEYIEFGGIQSFSTFGGMATANQVLSIVKTTDATEPSANGGFSISLPTGVNADEDITINYSVTGTATSGTDYTALSGTVILPAGSNSVALPVTVTDDNILELTEDVSVTLDGATGAGGFYSISTTQNAASLNISDDDATDPVKTVVGVSNGANAVEAGADGSFNVSLPAGVTSSEDITVNYTIAGTATAGVDYTSLSGTVVIPAGQNGVSVPVTTIDDQLLEGTETVVLTVTNGASTNFTFTPSTTAGNATVSISDDENVPVNLVLSIVKAADGSEPGTSAGFNISLPAGVLPSQDITVNYTAGGTATGGSDYTTLSGTVVIPAGQNGISLPVTVTDDKVIENAETVLVTLTGGTGTGFTYTVSATNGNASANIADDDNIAANRIISISITTQPAEPSTNGVYTISLPAGISAAEDITVTYTEAGDALSGVDYVALPGSVVIPAGQNSVTLPVVVIDDKILERGELKQTTITGGTSNSFTFTASTTNKTAIMTLADDDYPANAVITVSNDGDGAEPSTNGSFKFSLPAGYTSSRPTRINYTIGGTAVNGTDYVTLTGTVMLPAGQNSVSVPVTVIDDALLETTETVVVTATDATGPGFPFTISTTNGSATVNITDDENTPDKRVLSIVKTTDAAEPSTNGAFSISLPTGVLPAETITVNYTISGTAVAGTDYANLSGIVSIPAGANSVSLPVNVINDQLIENAETVIVTLTGGTSTNFTYTVSPTSGNATVNIADDDNTPANRTLTIQKLTDLAEPSTNGAFRVSLPSGIRSAEAVTVNYTVTGTGAAGTDYTALSGSVILPAGQNSVLIPADIIDDQVIEHTETVIVTLAGGASTSFTFTGTGNATANITDDESSVPANLVLSVTKGTDAAEPGTNGSFNISLPAGISSSEATTVNYTIGGTATSGTDYTALTGTATIPAGQNSVSVPVTVINDQLVENTETVILTLTGGASTSFTFTVSATNGNATVNITDDENSTTNRVLNIVKTTDAAEPSTNGLFTISLPAGVTPSEAITVNYTVSGTATAGVDYTALSGTVVIPAGQNSVILPVTVANDQIIEGAETLIVTLGGGSSANFTYTVSSTNGNATANIADDDNTAANLVLTVTKTADAAEPGANGAFSISLPAGITSSRNIALTYTIGAGTATPGTDYTAITGAITIPAGQNSVSVPVAVINNTVIEPVETVILNISSGNDTQHSYTVTGGGSATVNITDDDYAPNSNVVLITKVRDAIEGGANGQYRVSFQPGVTSSEDVVISFTLGGTATNSTDYSLLGLSAGNIVIPTGANEVFIDVDAGNDGIIEGPESVVLNLTSAASSSYPFTIDPSSNGATVNIVDANAASSTPLQVLTGTNAAEPGANATFTVKLAGVATSAWPVTVGYSLSGTAVSGIDYQGMGTVVIPANQNSVTVNLNVIDDQIIEPTETMTFTIISGSATDGGGNAFIFPPDPANDDITVNIADNDATAANQVLKVVKSTDAAEPNVQGNFTVSLPAGYTSSANLTLNYTMTGTATRNTDYSVFTITLPAYNNSVTIPLNVTDDKIIESTETAILNLNGGTDGNSFTYAADAGSATATLNIADDDNTTANNVLLVNNTADGAEPSTNGQFTISLPAGYTSSEPVTVNYTVDGTATTVTDYASIGTSIVLPAGQNSITLPVTVADDQIIEGVETVELTLSNGASTSFTFAASTGNDNAVVNIDDNDNTLANQVLSITKTTDGAEPSTNGAFSISLPTNVTATEPITVNYTISGTALNGTDYATLSGTIVLPAGQNSVPLPFTVTNDQIIEGTETVIATLNGGASASFSFTGTGNATADIADDDNVPANQVLNIANTADGAEPGSNGAFRISLPAGTTAAEAITVNYTIGGTATGGSDYATLSGAVIIPAGQNGVNVPVTVIDDEIIENTETVILTLTGGASTSFTFTGTGNATVNITDDESTTPANLVLSVIRTTDAAEPAANGEFVISLPTGVTVAEPVTVNYTITGTATDGTDYANLAGSAVIPANQNSVAVPLTVTDDQIVEGNETVTMTLNSGSSTSFTFTPDATSAAADMDLADNDNTPANLVLSITKNTDAAEPATNGAFTISLPTGVTASQDITVNYTASGTATAGTDYATLGGSVVIPAGQNSVSLPVTVSNDQIIETTETVIVSINGGTTTGLTLTPSSANGSATLNITDDESTTPANLVLAISKNTDAAEPSANGEFTISLPAGITAAENITATYTVAGTAIAGTDYTTLSGSAVIPAGQNSVAVPVTVTDDQIIENTETVIATLTGGSSANFTFTGSGNATVDITDNDNVPANLVLNVTKAADGAEPSTNGAFTISLPAGYTAAEDVTVSYIVAGTADAGADYTAIASAVVIPAGQNSINVPVTVADDQIIEGTETVTFTLGGGSSTNFTFTGTGSATVNIADNDNTPANLVLSVTKGADGAEPATNGSFDIKLPAGYTAAEDITVSYTITGTATNGTDYTAIPATALIPAGQNGVTVPVTVTDDQVIENTETVIMTLNGGSSTSFTLAGAGNATVNITDNDNVPANLVLSIAKNTDAAEPGTNGQFTISLPAGVTAVEDITVNYAISGTAQNGTDYANLGGSIVIPAGQNSVSLPVTVADDQVIEQTETVIATLNGGASASFTFTGTGNATASIADNDNIPANRVLTVVKTTDGAEPGTDGQFTISLPAGVTVTENVTVNYIISGTAASGADYTALSGAAVIPAGQNSVSVTVPVLDDQVIEATETVILTLNGGSSTSFSFTGTGNATVNITDDEANTPASLVLSVSKGADGAEPGTDGSFNISLPAGITSSEAITVNYTIAGTATAAADYTTLSGSVVLPAGQNSVSVPVDVLNDQVLEQTETVILTLNGGASTSFTLTGTGNATVNITDDENTPANRVISITKNTDASEPSTNGSFTVSLPAGVTVGENVTVNYTVAGTATAGADYTTLSGTVVIPAGQNSASLPVTVTDDQIIEQTETVIATITGGTSANFSFTGSGNATVNITDDESSTPANLVLSIIKGADGAEPNTNGSFTISLPAGITSSEDVTVNYTVTGTAIAGADYTTLSGTATIPAGQNSVSVPVTVTDDQIIEVAETVIATLSGGTSTSFTFTGTGNATVNITDDESTTPANLVLNVTKDADGAEPSTNGGFTISLPAGVTASVDLTATYTTAGTAASGTDYTALTGTVIIPAGQNSVSVPVTVTDDQLIEGNETVIINATGGTATGLTFTPGANATATVNIADDDNTGLDLVVSATKPNAAEPSTAGEYSISLASGKIPDEDITVTYTMSGTATAGTDYTALSGTVVIPAGQSSITVPVPVSNDNLVEPAETVIMTLTGGRSASITYTIGTNSSATVNIADNDNTNLKLLITASQPDAIEPGTDGAFTISLADGKRTADPITIQYMIGGTATLDADYRAITGAITIPAGAGSVTVPVNVLNDDEIETPETVIFMLTGGTSASYTYAAAEVDEATVTITDTDKLSGDLIVTKEIIVPATGPYRMGQDLTYRIRVRNAGNILMTGVKAEDRLPVQLDVPTHTAAERGEVVVTPSTKLVEWNIGSLQPGATVQMTLTSRVIEGGQLINEATAFSADIPDADSANNIAAATTVVEGSDLSFPNVITPNGDGKNEKFIIGGLEKYPGSALYIFNRWGGQVYQSKDYRNDWDGSDLNESTYYYVLEVKKPDGIKKYKGWITIIR